MTGIVGAMASEPWSGRCHPQEFWGYQQDLGTPFKKTWVYHGIPSGQLGHCSKKTWGRHQETWYCASNTVDCS